MGKHRLLLPVLLAFLAGASPAHAWTWPASGPVLQHFSYNGDPYAAGQHRGVDVGGSSGEPVLAPAAGSITFAGTVPGGGRTITIRTPDGFAVTLLHLGTITEVRGASVAEGAHVGTLGSSGTSEWAQPYVHLGVRQASDEAGYLDPENFLPPRVSASETAAEVEADAEPTPSEAPAAEQAESTPGQTSPDAQATASEPEGGQTSGAANQSAHGEASPSSLASSSSSAVGALQAGIREPARVPAAEGVLRREPSTADTTPPAARAPQVRGSRAVAVLMVALLAGLVASGGLAAYRFGRGRNDAEPAWEPSPEVPDFVPSSWLDAGCVSRGRVVEVPARRSRACHRSPAPSRTCERRASSLQRQGVLEGRSRRAVDRSRRATRSDREEAQGVR